MVKRIALAAVMVAVTACDPDLPDDTSLVVEPRLLAVAADPAEVAPGGSTVVTGLYATGTGVAAEPPLDWAFCTARKPFTESGPVDPGCLSVSAPDAIELGTGAAVDGTVPVDACRLFGPDRPDAEPGEPAGRPADPDHTGGYYQPLRVLAEDDYSLAQLRLRCGLPGATGEQATEYQRRTRLNVNPELSGASIARGGDDQPLVALEVDPESVATVAPGETVTLTARWPRCPTEPVCGDGVCHPDDDATCADDCAPQLGCGGAEVYAWFDPEVRAVVTRREAMRVSWFTTGGELAEGHTGRPEAEADNASTDNAWTAPDAPGEIHLWAVLRDDRGGAAWATYRIAVER